MDEVVFVTPAEVDPASAQLIAGLCCRFHARIRHALEMRHQPWLPELRTDPLLVNIRADPEWRVNPNSGMISRRIRESMNVHMVVSADDEIGLARALISTAPGLQIDLDDAHCPSWQNTVRVQKQLREFCSSTSFHGSSPVLGFRPRSLHLAESSVLFHGEPVAGPLVDLGMFLAANADAFANNRFACGPVIYIPKLETYEEALIWGDILKTVEELLPVFKGRLKSIAMMENIRAAFQMEEILYALRESVLALNLGKFDYVFSFIKRFPDKLLPPRHKISSQPFMKSCLTRMSFICNRRGAIATTGMCPCMNPTSANLKSAFDAKQLEAHAGSSGALVAHLDFVAIVHEAFTEITPCLSDTSTESLSKTVPFEGFITEEDVTQALRVALHLCHSWIAGRGTAIVDDNMEDLATAEVCRSLVRQWCTLKAFDLDRAVAIAREIAEREGCQTAIDIVLKAIRPSPAVPYLTDYLIPVSCGR